MKGVGWGMRKERQEKVRGVRPQLLAQPWEGEVSRSGAEVGLARAASRGFLLIQITIWVLEKVGHNISSLL